MASYWGLKAIASRMNWQYERTPVRQLQSTGFPIYRRKKGGRTMWFTEDALIQLWQLQRVKLDREKLLQGARSKSEVIDATSRSNV